MPSARIEATLAFSLSKPFPGEVRVDQVILAFGIVAL